MVSASFQLKEMAERLPQGAFKHGRSQSLARLDMSNGLQSSSEVLGLQPQPFSPKIISPNGISSNLLPGLEPSQLLGSSQSTGIDGDMESTLGRLGGSARRGEGDTNGHDAAQQSGDESSRPSGNSLPENGREPDTEWVEQDEPGVYITLTALPGGGKDLKRVRFRYADML